ncbi:MAG: hypothetical protein WDM94_01815 [Bauldia sp.]
MNALEFSQRYSLLLSSMTIGPDGKIDLSKTSELEQLEGELRKYIANSAAEVAANWVCPKNAYCPKA